MNENNMKKIINQDSLIIVGIILLIIVVLSIGSFAFITWRSTDGGELITKIGDIATIRFKNGVNINTNKLVPVLNYEDGSELTFSIEKTTDDSVYVNFYLTINSIDEELKNDKLKYILLEKQEKEYIPVTTGDFSKIENDNTLNIVKNYQFDKTAQEYKLYIYIDGTKNNQNMDNKNIDINLNVEADTKINDIEEESNETKTSNLINEEVKDKQETE